MAVFKITLSAKLNSLGLYKNHVNASLKKKFDSLGFSKHPGLAKIWPK